MKNLQYLNSKKWLRSVKKTTRRKSRLGYSLVEITIVMAIVAGLLAAVLTTYQRVTDKIKISNFLQLSSQITATIEGMDQYKVELKDKGKYSWLVAKRANLASRDLRYDTDGKSIIGIISPYDSYIEIFGENRKFKAIYWDLPQDACVAILDQFLGKAMSSVGVNGKAQTLPVRALSNDAACDNSTKSGNNQIEFIY